MFGFPCRTQSHHCWFGQCWENNNPLPVVSDLTTSYTSDLLLKSFCGLIWNVFFPLFIFSLTKEAVHTSPTIGSNVEEIIVRNTHFMVWDIGGQESLRASWYSYYCNTEVQLCSMSQVESEQLKTSLVWFRTKGQKTKALKFYQWCNVLLNGFLFRLSF